MSPIRILAILLIVGGGLGLAYGNFSYTKETHEAQIGSLELSIEDKETVHIPQWLGAAAIGGGILLLLFDRKQS